MLNVSTEGFAKQRQALRSSTPIPTSLRGRVRALVKAHADWPAYLTGKDIVSANARNVDLIEFALRHPTLKAQIEHMLQTHTAAAPKQSAAVLMLVNRIEKLLAAYAARKPRVRVKAVLQQGQ
jgi:hypothetical protein